MLILPPPASATICLFSLKLYLFTSVLLSFHLPLPHRAPPISDRATTSFCFRHLSVSLLRLSFEATRSGRATHLFKTFSSKGLEAAADREMKKRPREPRREAELLFSCCFRVPREIMEVSLMCDVSILFSLFLLWLFHILLRLFAPFFFFSCLSSVCHVESDGEETKLYFQKSELGSSSFQPDWTNTIKSELSSSLNRSYSTPPCSPFLHLQEHA